LQQLGITDLTVTPDPVRIATEGALFGSPRHEQLLARIADLEKQLGTAAPAAAPR
jgi:hypothetical protein